MEGLKRSLMKSRSSLSCRRIGTNGGGKKLVLNPQGKFLQKWNKIFVLSCVIAVSVDPLFFYIPVLNNYCLDLDTKLQVTATVLRSFTDIFYTLHILFQFRTAFIAPSSRVFGRGVLVQDAWVIANRYMSSYLLVDVLSVLPLPQVVILLIIPKMGGGGSRSLNTKNLLKLVVLLQYIPRMLRIYPLYKEVTRTSGILTQTAWAGAAFNLFLYMLASHVLGAFWYLFSIERETSCWREACGYISQLGCGCRSAACYNHDDHNTSSQSQLAVLSQNNNNYNVPAACLISKCHIEETTTTKGNPPPDSFDFGIFLPALRSGVVNSTDFPQKVLYCSWWGLKNLSSLGQNLNTSNFVWEICFAVFICISGLVLFSFLIGNMQKYLQSTTIRLEEMRVKRQDAEQWMSHRLLPEALKERIRRYQQYKWQQTRGVDEDHLIRNLPKDLRRDIKRHLCLKLLKRVPMFEKMDEQLMDAMCHRLKPVLYTEKSYILREGDPVDDMLFVMRGRLLTATTNGGRTGFFNSDYLRPGDFCGEELLTWALDPHTSSNLPISTRTVEALEEVEAFALTADDLKFVASQFRRLHSKQLRHTFRFYSHQWRTWAACFIQVAWRRYIICRNKLLMQVDLHDSRIGQADHRLLQNINAFSTTGSPASSLGATIYASRFVANLLRGLRRRNGKMKRSIMPDKLLPLKLQKPAEPDFTAQD